MTSAYSLDAMPRLGSTQRVERAREAIESAVQEIQKDLDRNDYDTAWKNAEELARVLEAGRISNSRVRSLIVATLMRRERYRLRQISERFGVSVSWLAKLSAAAKDETIPADLPTTEPESPRGRKRAAKAGGKG